jgi:hypothetical protein
MDEIGKTVCNDSNHIRSVVRKSEIRETLRKKIDVAWGADCISYRSKKQSYKTGKELH